MQEILSRRSITQPVFGFLAYTILVSAGAVINLLSIPADPRNQVFMGYSAARLALAGAFLVFLLSAAGVFWFSWHQKTAAEWLARVLFSNFAALIALLASASGMILLILSFLTTLRLVPVFPNRFLMERLQPALWLADLVCLGLLVFQTALYRRQPWDYLWRGIKCARDAVLNAAANLVNQVSAEMTQTRAVLLVVAAAAPLLFWAALSFDFPTGSAGLYALMADGLIQNRFALPLEVPYYGPGGLPFAYPPAGFYLMALVEQFAGVTVMDYLRFAPPIFAILSVIPVVLVAYHFSGSHAGAFLAGLIVAASSPIYHVNVTAGGAVRGLAAAFGLWAVWLFLFSVQKGALKAAAFSGVLAGLSALTHLGYAEFIALFFAAYILTGRFSRRTLASLFTAGAAGLLVVLPWLAVVYGRYGIGVFSGAFQSHENNYFLNMFANRALVLPWLENTLRPLAQEPLLWALILLGLLDALLRRKLLLVIWFGMVLLLTAENTRYLVTIGALLASLIVARLHSAFLVPGEGERSRNGPALRGAIFLFSIAVIFYSSGWATITQSYRPVVSPETFDIAQYAREITPSDAVFLTLTDDGQAEWFPYLLHRVPVAGTWGAEWLGTYGHNLSIIFEVNKCVETDSPACLNALLPQFPSQPSYMITLTKNASVNNHLSESTAWRNLYRNERYLLWQSSGDGR